MKRVLLLVAAWLVAAGAGAADCEPAQFTVALDVGHTHARPGATSARGRPEFEFNRALAGVLAEGLAAAGFPLLLINADGAIAGLKQRTAAAQAGGADLFLSVHHDSVQPHYLRTWTVNGQRQRYSDRFQGYSLFVSARQPAYEHSRRFATLLAQQLQIQGFAPTLHHAEPIKGENRPLLDAKLGLYRYDDLVVLRTAAMPAVLLEAGVIVHRGEELELSDPARQARYVTALVAAVTAYCRSSGQL